MEKKKILIIDDEESFTLGVKLNLEKSGKYEVKAENRGSEGLVAAKKFKPDLILLDIMMPDKAGDEIAYQLENDALTKDIPVVFLTALTMKEETEGKDNIIGGHPFVAKPMGTEELIDCIEQNIS